MTRPTWLTRLARKKPVDLLVAEASGGLRHPDSLGRSISLFELIMLGVGGTIGTGIFFVLTQQAPVAGPAVILSFLIAALVAGLTALCYAELSSMIPVSGSSYSYAYVTLGEGVAYFVAACLILEYGVSAAAVAVGWGEYCEKLLSNLTGLTLPHWATHAPITLDPSNVYSLRLGGPGAGLLNLPSVVLIGLCSLLLIGGSRESARVNAIMVLVKLAVLAMFVVIAFSRFNAANLVPFAPHGLAGIGASAGSIFFTFVGLDVIATAGEEVVEPRRNLPRAIIMALIVVGGFYVLVAPSALGVQPADKFAGQEAGLAVILENVTGARWPANLLAAGAVVSIFSVTLVVLYGQVRILYAMSRDGLLPPIFHRLNKRTLTPVACTVMVGLFAAVIAAFIPADVLWDLTSMGTLVAFTVVSAGVIILRARQPDAPRTFKVPFYPFLPLLSIASCLYLICQLHMIVFELTVVWGLIAAAIYVGYSARRSRLETPEGSAPNR